MEIWQNKNVYRVIGRMKESFELRGAKWSLQVYVRKFPSERSVESRLGRVGIRCSKQSEYWQDVKQVLASRPTVGFTVDETKKLEIFCFRPYGWICLRHYIKMKKNKTLLSTNDDALLHISIVCGMKSELELN